MRKDIRQAAGRRVEDRVFEAVSSLAGVKAYRNVYVPNGGGRTAEIDLILLSNKGITILESKAYGSGYIVGSKTRYEWAHHYKPPGPKSKKKVAKFYNPLRQVQKQMEVLSRYLGVPVKHISGVVAFSDCATLRKVPSRADNCDCVVLQTRFVASHIKRCLSRRMPCFSPAVFRRLQQHLDAVPRASASTKRRHIAQAREAERMRRAEQEHRRASRNRS